MDYRAIRVAVLLSSLPLAGCGTVASLARPAPPGSGGKAPFGGVKQDVYCIQKAATGECSLTTHAKSESVRHPQVAVVLCCAADLPLSLIGDVVTWPYVVGYNFVNQPVPVPPLVQAPPSPPPPVTEAPAEEAPPAEKSELLPDPRKLP